MKRFVFLAALTLSLVLAQGLAAAEADFTIQAPEGWTKKTNSAAKAHYLNGAGSLIVTVDSQVGATPDSHLTYVKEQFAKSFKNTRFEPVVLGKMDGLETRELVYTAEVSGYKFKYDVLYVFKGGKAYTLTGGNMADLFDPAFSADLKKFFSSFHLK